MIIGIVFPAAQTFWVLPLAPPSDKHYQAVHATFKGATFEVKNSHSPLSRSPHATSCVACMHLTIKSFTEAIFLLCSGNWTWWNRRTASVQCVCVCVIAVEHTDALLTLYSSSQLNMMLMRKETQKILKITLAASGHSWVCVLAMRTSEPVSSPHCRTNHWHSLENLLLLLVFQSDTSAHLWPPVSPHQLLLHCPTGSVDWCLAYATWIAEQQQMDDALWWV